jgi:hypothetical protein
MNYQKTSIAVGAVLAAAAIFFIGRRSASGPRPGRELDEPVAAVAGVGQMLPAEIPPMDSETETAISVLNMLGKGHMALANDGWEMAEEEVVDRSEFDDEVSALAGELFDSLERESERDVKECLRKLARYRKLTLLNALRGLVRHGNVEQRKNALYALALSFGSGSSKKRAYYSKDIDAEWTDRDDLGVIADGRGEPDNAAELSAQISHDIVCTVEDGLSDEDADVKQVAFDAMLSLEEEERGVLAQQVLSGEDAAMKLQLISSISGSKDHQDVMLSIAALESDDPALRDLAKNNVKMATGQDFATQDEALDWLESHTESAIRTAESNLATEGELLESSSVSSDGE